MRGPVELGRVLLAVVSVAAVAGAGAEAAAQQATPLERVVREAWVMGTLVRVVAEAADRARAEQASEAALREIERLESVLSSWGAAGELGRANASEPGRPVAVSAELGALLLEAEGWAARTERAFEPALGALVDAWELRGAGRVPTASELEGALAATGPAAISVASDVITRHDGRAWIDSGGFGKGAALRVAAGAAREVGVTRLLIDLGGQLWTEAAADAPWPVEIAHPRERERPVLRLAAAGASVATSGTSERPGHILDPRTGLREPAWGSVTVVAADPLEADVLATALYVMGPEEGLSWARAHGVAALFLEPTAAGLRSVWTEPMADWLLTPTHSTTSRHDNDNERTRS